MTHDSGVVRGMPRTEGTSMASKCEMTLPRVAPIRPIRTSLDC